jgi:hypothetical protein
MAYFRTYNYKTECKTDTYIHVNTGLRTNFLTVDYDKQVALRQVR